MTSKIIYTATKYRLNLINFWRQFNPLYDIPKGFHVHHIVPRSVCKQEGWTDEEMNHPRNLIALHPDDHASIHRNRGDKQFSDKFIINGSNSWCNSSDDRRIKQSQLMSELNKRLKSKPKENRVYKCSYCQSTVEKEEFCHHKPKEHYYCDAKCRNRFIFEGKPLSDEHKKNVSETRKQKKIAPWNKGKHDPNGAENGRKGAKKQSETIRGRRIVIRDGQRRWAYPSDPDYPSK